MREIKFRIWDKDEKCMKQVDCIYFPINSASYKNISAYNEKENHYEWIYDYELMQYTGLKDKNGKEIYEGDIVKYENAFFKRIGKIVFGLYDEYLKNDLGFYVKWFKSNDIIDDLSEIREDLGYWRKLIEVIGNIYENPELLVKNNF